MKLQSSIGGKKKTVHQTYRWNGQKIGTCIKISMGTWAKAIHTAVLRNLELSENDQYLFQKFYIWDIFRDSFVHVAFVKTFEKKKNFQFGLRVRIS